MEVPEVEGGVGGDGREAEGGGDGEEGDGELRWEYFRGGVSAPDVALGEEAEDDIGASLFGLGGEVVGG